jgi:hypothetical protein
LLDFYEIQYEEHVIDGDLCAIIFSYKTTDVQTSEVNAKLTPVVVGP